jgi:hypothetical protein
LRQPCSELVELCTSEAKRRNVFKRLEEPAGRGVFRSGGSRDECKQGEAGRGSGGAERKAEPGRWLMEGRAEGQGPEDSNEGAVRRRRSEGTSNMYQQLIDTGERSEARGRRAGTGGIQHRGVDSLIGNAERGGKKRSSGRFRECEMSGIRRVGQRSKF